jgi:hypothetical protein
MNRSKDEAKDRKDLRHLPFVDHEGGKEDSLYPNLLVIYVKFSCPLRLFERLALTFA